MYSVEDEELQTISKIGTGFSEEQLVQLSEQLKALVIPAPKPYYRRALRFCERAGFPMFAVQLFCTAVRCLAWLCPKRWGCVHRQSLPSLSTAVHVFTCLHAGTQPIKVCHEYKQVEKYLRL